MAGEISDPQRNLPRALIAGALCVMLVYLVVNVGFLYALAPAQMAGSRLIAASVAGRIPLLGNAGAGVIAAAVVVAAFSGLNASMMTGSRVFFAMADRGLFFQAAARVSPRFQSPSVAIWLATALGVAYVLANDFAQLADKFVLGIWPFYALTVAAVLRAAPDAPGPAASLPRLGLPGGAGRLPGGLGAHGAERPGDRSAQYRRHLRSSFSPACRCTGCGPDSAAALDLAGGRIFAGCSSEPWSPELTLRLRWPAATAVRRANHALRFV